MPVGNAKYSLFSAPRPATCQPPITWFKKPRASPAIDFPLPNGKSAIQFQLTLCFGKLGSRW